MATRNITIFKWDKRNKKLKWQREPSPNVIGYDIFVGKDPFNFKYVGFYPQSPVGTDPEIDDLTLIRYGIQLPDPISNNDIVQAFGYALDSPPNPISFQISNV